MNSQHLRLKWHFEKLDKYGPRFSVLFFSFSFLSKENTVLIICNYYHYRQRKKKKKITLLTGINRFRNDNNT